MPIKIYESCIIISTPHGVKFHLSIIRVSTKEQTVENQKHQITRAFPDAEVIFAHPPGIRSGVFDKFIDKSTIICDLPFHPSAGAVIDHHLTNQIIDSEVLNLWRPTMSAARIAYSIVKTKHNLDDLDEFIKQKSSIIGVPENKLILAGISAGAGIAIWNGLRDDTNKNVIGIFTTLAQSTYNMYKWEKIFPDFQVDLLRDEYILLDDLFLKFYNNSITIENLKVLDYLNQMDKNDPPIFIYNPVYEDEVITKDNIIDFNVLFHSYKHGNAIRKVASNVGLQFSGTYQETPINFIRRMVQK